MRCFYLAVLFSALLPVAVVGTPAQAQFGRGNVNFGVLETGVLPGGAEIPDVTGDTVDPGVEARQPQRAQALPPPSDLFDNSSTPQSDKPQTKKRK